MDQELWKVLEQNSDKRNMITVFIELIVYWTRHLIYDSNFYNIGIQYAVESI